MIETHNQQMNASYDVDKLYQEYTDYRQLVTAHVRKIIKGGNDVLVIGAGNLNDIDISVFDESKVTFVDVDKTAVINGIKRQGQKVDNFNIIKGDLTGLDTTDFFSKLEASDIESYYDFDIKIELESYDVIVVLPIYTQLLLPQLMSRLDYDALQPFLPLIQNRIEVLNGFLRSHLKNKGQMILFFTSPSVTSDDLRRFL
jgi:hypothetical protein